MKKISMSFEEVPADAKLAIYGTGKRGVDYQKILSFCRPDVKIVCFLDSYKEDLKSTPPILRIDNFDPSVLDTDVILICSVYVSAIAIRLSELKLLPHEKIMTFEADWFTQVMPAYEEAMCVSIFKKLMVELPDEPFVYDALGRLEQLRGNYESALNYYKEAEKKFPENTWSYFGHTRALVSMGRYQEAEKLYKWIIKNFPEFSTGYIGYAQVLRVQGHYKEAEKIYQLAVEQFSDIPEGYLGRAKSLVEMNRYEEAKKIYELAIDRFPDFPHCYLGHADALLRLNMLEKAEGIYKTVIKKFPNIPEGFLGYADICLARTDYGESKKMYNWVIEKFSSNPSGYLGLSKLLLKMRSYGEAEVLLQQATERFKDNVCLLQLLETTYIEQEKYSMAQGVLSRITGVLGSRAQKNKFGPKKILFDHVRKCGGTTVSLYLTQQYLQGLVFSPPENGRDYFSSLNDEDRGKYDLIHGHYARQLLPLVRPEMIKTTVLRHPIDRALSLYFYGKSLSLPWAMDLVDFISNQNLYEYKDRFSTEEDRRNLSDSDLLKKCNSNITEQYDLVGVTERMDDFLGKLKKIAKLSVPYAGRRDNAVHKRKRVDEINPEIIELAKGRLEIDIQIYEMVKARWEAAEVNL